MNKTIFILWFQGFDKAPEIIKKCVQSWKYYNPEWKINLLDNTNLKDYININNYVNTIDKKINFTALSDIVRLILLDTYGGLWVDATTFCNRPLNKWLSTYVRNGFFAFNKPGPDRLLSTWFIYSSKKNLITQKWLNAVVDYWKIHNTPHTYYWVHYLFGDLYKTDNVFMSLWNNILKIAAAGPHAFVNKGMFGKISPKIKSDIDTKIAPLYKLTYKYVLPQYDKSLILYYLYSTIGDLQYNS